MERTFGSERSYGSLPGNLFFKRPSFVRPRPGGVVDTSYANGDLTPHKGGRPFDGNPRFGFQTLLDRVKVPLPTAPGIVGGNVDWTKLNSSPYTQFLSGKINQIRGMMPPPAVGKALNVGEPNGNSIHTNI